MKAEWCPGGGKPVDLPGQPVGIPGVPRPHGRVRCPACGRLLFVSSKNCEPYGDACWHPYIPVHKEKVKKARRSSRGQGKRPRNRLTKRGNRI